MEYEIEYNSQTAELIIPEYGRHVQNLIRHCKTIEDDKERQEFAESVVSLMLQMNPISKNVNEYKKKLWKHLFKIAQYDINITPPEGLDLSPDAQATKPDAVPYPKSISKHRHYGQYVKKLIEKAVATEDPETRQAFANNIAGFMMLAYKNWNKAHYVSEEIVKEDLKSMSGGVLEIDPDVSLDIFTKAVKNRRHLQFDTNGMSTSQRNKMLKMRNNQKNRPTNKSKSKRRRRK